MLVGCLLSDYNAFDVVDHHEWVHALHLLPSFEVGRLRGRD